MSSSKLSVGIVGLPNAGKSTLFNALASRRLAETASRPFTTIDPHEAVVSVPDKYLEKLSDLIDPKKTVPATVTFIDIAGLVKGAHKGEGLGNQFLGKIREVDAIVHVARAFSDPKVTHQHPSFEPGSIKQILEDVEIVNIELKLADIEKKPTIFVLNIGEKKINDSSSYDLLVENFRKKFFDKPLIISAKLEEELVDLNEKERKEYLAELKIKQSGLTKLIKKSYKKLDLISFYTVKGEKEVSAWSLKRGSSVIDAAENVHGDFAKNFIKAEVIGVEDLIKLGGWNIAKEKGKVRLEGRKYIVKDKDVIEFKVGV